MNGEDTAHKLVDSPYEGQKVWVEKDGRLVPMEVIVACGNACRLENSFLGISGWFSIYKIYTKLEGE